MSEVLFYHLEHARLESVLAGLLDKTLSRGWRAVVRCGSRAAADRLDEHLWTFSDESFLPHGAGVDLEEAAKQPIWLTDGAERPNKADILFLVDGAAATAAEVDDFVRCVNIFDGGDEEALGRARAFWKEMKTGGVEATYWRQSAEGRWEKQG